MKKIKHRPGIAFCALALGIGSAFAGSVQAAELMGRAVLPAATFADGPTSGQFTNGGNGYATPFVGKQPVQGFSAIVDGPKKGTYYVMMDNGFGSKANSPDVLLRMYAVKPDFKTGIVHPVDRHTGKVLAEFDERSYFTLSDPKKNLPFQIVADLENYPGNTVSVPGPVPVAPAIRKQRLLTGWDFDLESVRRTADGSFWFGEEFGPFLIRTDRDGRVLDAPFSLPNFNLYPSTLGGSNVNPWIQSSSNPLLANPADVNLGNSGGFEGLALNISGTRLYAMLEKAISGDENRNRLWIHEFNPKTKAYTGRNFGYLMDSPNHAMGDLTAITDREYLVIERDNGQGDASNPNFTNPARFKKIFKINLDKVDENGNLVKQEVVDLMNIYDPRDIAGDGPASTVFTFPFVTIEDVIVVDNNTLLVVNDNNYPFSAGREFGVADNNEFILLHVAPLDESQQDCKQGKSGKEHPHGK